MTAASSSPSENFGPEDRRPVVRYGRWVVRYRWPILLLSLLLTGLAGSGGRLLGFDNSYRVFFGPDNPQLLAFDALENIYNKNDNVMIVLEPKSGDVFEPGFLELVAEVTEAGWQLPFARRVDSITNYQHTRAEEDDLIVEDLVVEPASASPSDLEGARAVALQEPLLRNKLISGQSHVTAINVTLEMPGESPFETTEATAAARELVAQIESDNPDVNVYMTGVVLLNNAFAEGGQNDMKTLTPLMFLIMAIVIAVLLRSISASFTTLLVILFSTVTALGIAGFMGIKFTPPSSVAPTMIMTLAVADSIHLLISLLGAMAKGMPKRDAVIESLRVNVQPVFITSLTTAIGFASLNFSDAPPFRDLGNMAAIGVIAAFVYSVLFLPALMMVLPVGAPKRGRSWGWGMEGLADFVINRRRPLLWGSVGVVILMALFIPRNDPNDIFVDYFDESVRFRSDSDFIMDNLTGLYQLDYNLTSGESGGISEPEYLATLDRFAEWFRQQDGVMQVNMLSHTMKRLNKNMHGDDPEKFSLPQNRDLAAQYLLLYEMSLPFGLDLNNQINVDKSSTRFSVTLENLSSKEMRAIAQSGEAWLQQNAPEVMFSRGIGPAIMFSYISERNIRSMVGGTLIALVLISISMVFALRSTRYGLLSLVPNLVPAALSFGLWGLLVSRIDIGLSTVVAISLGIVVDDSVHFLSKYLRARREHGFDAPEAVRYAFTSVGKALVVTSLILVAGFLVMTRSTFAMNSNMGWFTAIAITFALVADFTLLPALLMKADEQPKPGTSAIGEAEALANA